MDHRVGITAFVLIGLVVGCGTDPPQPHPAPAPRTGHFTVTIEVARSSGNASLRASGAFDDDRQRYAVNGDISGFGPSLDGPIAIVAVPDAVYIDCPTLTRVLEAPTRWIKVTGHGGQALRSSFIDPLRSLGGDGRGGLVPGTTMRFADGQEGDVVLFSLDYFDLGAPVAIEPPPPEEVTDETAAVNRLFGGTTGG